jgi:hypothetical protein
MLISEATYKNPATFQTARIVIIKRPNSYYVKANIGGEDIAGIPAWTKVATTEHDARTIGNVFHGELKKLYGMRRLS